MLVEVIDVFDDPALQRAADGDIVEHGQMLHIFAESHPSGMRADRNAEFRRQQQDRKYLVHAANTTGIDLADAERVRLQELLEEHAVLHHLARGDLDRRDCLGDGGMPEHVVRTGRLFDPPRVDIRQITHPVDGLRHVPRLIGVQHQDTLWPNEGT